MRSERGPKRSGGPQRAIKAERTRSSRFFGNGHGLSCDDVANALPGIVDGFDVAEPELRRHVDVCLRCQAELVQYRKVLRVLRDLRTQVIEPAPGLLPDILATLGTAGERRAMHHLLTGRRVAYVGGIAAATAAAGAAGAIVLVNRARTRRLRLAG